MLSARGEVTGVRDFGQLLISGLTSGMVYGLVALG